MLLESRELSPILIVFPPMALMIVGCNFDALIVTLFPIKILLLFPIIRICNPVILQFSPNIILLLLPCIFIFVFLILMHFLFISIILLFPVLYIYIYIINTFF